MEKKTSAKVSPNNDLMQYSNNDNITKARWEDSLKKIAMITEIPRYKKESNYCKIKVY